MRCETHLWRAQHDGAQAQFRFRAPPQVRQVLYCGILTLNGGVQEVFVQPPRHPGCRKRDKFQKQ